MPNMMIPLIPNWSEYMHFFWTEFKTVLLPWVLAAIVCGVLISEHRHTTSLLTHANTQLAQAVAQQGSALDGVKNLLATQGYVSVPTTGAQSK